MDSISIENKKRLGRLNNKHGHTIINKSDAKCTIFKTYLITIGQNFLDKRTPFQPLQLGRVGINCKTKITQLLKLGVEEDSLGPVGQRHVIVMLNKQRVVDVVQLNYVSDVLARVLGDEGEQALVVVVNVLEVFGLFQFFL